MKKALVIILSLAVLGVAGLSTQGGRWLRVSLLGGPHEYAVLHTNHGNIKIKLLFDEAPTLAENFWRIGKDKKYDGTIFHRVIDGFMIQGGDYELANGTGGESAWGGLLPDEFSPKLSHVRGAVSMANRGADTNGSQFFIVQKDAPFLDGRHSIFGQVVDGMTVVDTIAKIKTDMNDRPLEEVKIDQVTFE